MQHMVASKAADVIHVLIQQPVVEAANDHPHRMAEQRMVEGGQFPAAEMSGEHKHAFASCFRGQVVFHSLRANPISRVVDCVARHAAELDKVPAKIAKEDSQNALAFGVWQLRHYQFQVALAYSP